MPELPSRHLECSRSRKLRGAVPAVPRWPVERPHRRRQPRRLHPVCGGHLELSGGLHDCRRLHGLSGGQVESHQGCHQRAELHAVRAGHMEQQSGCVTAGHLPEMSRGHLEQPGWGQRAGHLHSLRSGQVPAGRRAGQPERLPEVPQRQLHRCVGCPNMHLLPGWHLGACVGRDGLQPLPSGSLDASPWCFARVRVHTDQVELHISARDREAVERGVLGARSQPCG
mmetsp:Transcript_132677/g.369902  ORF Transcript_132677/g.369902 Transcript_132677/m.369902 type:complete len:226 (+) Transcript_132677:472-1149(+)